MRADRVLSRAKRPLEEFRFRWDFQNDLEESDTYATHVISAATVAGVDVTATLLEGAARVGSTGAVLVVQVQGGTDGVDYDIRFRLNTTQGDVFERVVRMQVRA